MGEFLICDQPTPDNILKKTPRVIILRMARVYITHQTMQSLKEFQAFLEALLFTSSSMGWDISLPIRKAMVNTRTLVSSNPEDEEIMKKNTKQMEDSIEELIKFCNSSKQT